MMKLINSFFRPRMIRKEINPNDVLNSSLILFFLLTILSKSPEAFAHKGHQLQNSFLSVPYSQYTDCLLGSSFDTSHADSHLKKIKTISRGYYPYKFINIDLKKILGYNQYEGLRLGIGLLTNEGFSKQYAFGGYIGYGLHDKHLKYGGRAIFDLQKGSAGRLELSYMHDVSAMGGYQLLEKESILSPKMLRLFLIDKMDREIKKQITYSFRPTRYVKLSFFMQQSDIDPYADYRFSKGGETYKGTFHLAEIGLRSRLSLIEHAVSTPRGKIRQDSHIPVLYGNVFRGINRLNGNFEYIKLTASLVDHFQIKWLGKFRYKLIGGMTGGQPPAFKLYNGHGSFGSRFNIYAPNSFATMRFSEFIADRFISFFLRQDLTAMLFQRDRFFPRIAWINNMGWGWLNDQDNHQGISLQTFDKGYFETGLVLDDLLRTLLFNYGFGVFYRYGPYGFQKFSNNLVYKLKISVNFNF
jgi:hypothetical protein